MLIMAERVNHPPHYNAGGIECIDALEAATSGLQGIEAFCTANAIKYLWRWKLKNGEEDLQKAVWYINRLIQRAGADSAAGKELFNMKENKHPYSAYERGTNENINKMIRRFLPKGTDFRKVTAAYIQRVETWINNYPREILGFETSGSLFERYVAEAA